MLLAQATDAAGDISRTSTPLVNLAYVLASAMFIYGLKQLSHPRTAVRGNLIAAAGMLLAITVTLLNRGIIGFNFIIAGLIIGGVIGGIIALRVRMTAMPELVGMLNGFGGVASLLVASAEFLNAANPGREFLGSVYAAGIIGSVTFFGSLIAAAKLKEIKWLPRGGLFRGQQFVNAILILIALGCAAWGTWDADMAWTFWPAIALAAVIGVLVVTPIGGADMPVVICLLNSYSGLAAAATGFVLNNNGLIIAGSLVGSSGIILTRIMCRAMNRSLAHVLFGTMGPTAGSATADEVYGGRVKSTSADEVAMLFDTARRVVIVPGYGLAVAQAQHAVRDLTNLLESRGVEVEFGIHPVAGRMPGHMNVLLAEANIPYDQIRDLDDINPTFEQTDVAIVIGANDVVNPAARTDPASPIAGMPILDVDKARTCIVIKRSLSPGFAGIPNPLFAADRTLMFFGDGKKAVLDLITAVKES
ncbi:MAG: NAD(P)(+) transhydrogenase (Re/Si-specific) subunit beta [Phycisphaerae bacterium]